MAGDEVQQIKDRINIVDIVGQYVQLRRAGRTYMARCPFHKERTPSFHVSPERGTYKCFGCGEGGDVFTFVQKMDGIDFSAALKMLAEKAGVKLENRSPRPAAEVEKSERLIQICNDAAEFFKVELRRRKDVQDYIETRGVKKETTEIWNIGYAPAMWDALSRHLLSKSYREEDIIDSGLVVKSERTGRIFDRFRGRIMFPISDSSGKIIAFSGRFYEKVQGQKEDIEPAKYINSPETLIFKKSRVLYGLDKATQNIRKIDRILLVEGQFDLIMSHQSGFPYAVALSGTALTEEHLQRLGKLSKNLVLALDGDEAGIRSGFRSAQMALAHGFRVKIPEFSNGKDPADIAKENPELLKAILNTSKWSFEFFLGYLWKKNPNPYAYEKSIEKELLPLVSVIQNSVEQKHALDMIARHTTVHDAAKSYAVFLHEMEVLLEKTKNRSKVPESIEESSPEVHAEGGISTISALHKKVGMVLFGWAEGRAKLAELLGDERLHTIETEVAPLAETLRFEFDREVGEHTSEATIAGDMLEQIGATLARERYKMKAL